MNSISDRITFKQINQLAIPAIFSGIAESLITLTDIAMIGHVPDNSVEALAAAGSEAVFTYSDHSWEEILTKTELDLTVEDDKATLTMSMHVDSDAFFTALKDEQTAAVKSELEKMGYNYEEMDAATKDQLDASLLSDDDLQKMVDDTVDQMASSLDGSYDAKTGVVTADVFKADVTRSSKTFEITKVNAAVGEGLIVKGENYQYSYKDGVLTFEGETDADDIVFEKE